MSFRTVKYVVCDRCDSSSRNDKATFEEYPNGAGMFLGSRIDLCDRCVEAGFVVFQGQIKKASEIDVDQDNNS
jgi:hypothetical protein